MTERIKIHGSPGCGKTYSMIVKYRTLLNSGYRPEDITVITFRKSSANDLIHETMKYAKVFLVV